MMVRTVANVHELNQILHLQAQNHYTNITENIKIKDGFVTVKHDISTLKAMNTAAKQIIALDKNKVIGYALAMPREFQQIIPVLIPMFEMFSSIQYKGKQLSLHNYYVMGQICIAKEYRGKGIFKMLYDKHQEIYSSTYDLILTEVSSSNIPSMKAHQKVGFETIHSFQDATDHWHILAWDLQSF